MTANQRGIRALAHQHRESPTDQAGRNWHLAARLITNSDEKKRGYPTEQEKERNMPGEKKNPDRTVDPSEVKGPPEPEQPDQT